MEESKNPNLEAEITEAIESDVYSNVAKTDKNSQESANDVVDKYGLDSITATDKNIPGNISIVDEVNSDGTQLANSNNPVSVTMPDKLDTFNNSETRIHQIKDHKRQRVTDSDNTISDTVKLYIKDNQWVCSVEGIETYLGFDDEKCVTWKVLNEDLYIIVDDRLYEVSLDIEKNLHLRSDKSIILKAHQREDEHSLELDNYMNSNMEYKDDHALSDVESSQPSEAVKEIKTERLCPQAADAHCRFTDIHCKRQHNSITVMKRDNRWILLAGRNEIVLEYGENADISFEIRNDDLYLIANGVLFKVSVNSDSGVPLSRIKKTVIMPAPKLHETTAETFPDNTKCRSFQSEMARNNGEPVDAQRRAENQVIDGNAEFRRNYAATSGLCQLNIEGRYMEANRDSILISSKDNQTLIGQPMADSKGLLHNSGNNFLVTAGDREYYAGSKPGKGTRYEIPETLDPIFLDQQGSPPNVSCAAQLEKNSNRKFNSSRHSGISNLVIPDHKCRISVNPSTDHEGAIPKKPKLQAELKATDDQVEKQITAGKTTTSDDPQIANSSLTEGKHNHSQKKQSYEKNVDRPIHGHDGLPQSTFSATTVEKVQEPILSTGIKVDRDNTYRFLRQSKILRQLEGCYSVKILPKKFSECQGFVITGESSAMKKTEKKLGDTIQNVISDTVTVEKSKMPVHEANKHVLCLENKIKKKFDIYAEFNVGQLKTDDQAILYFDKGETNGQIDNEKKILRNESPKAVSWLFPGGYKISLLNRVIEETVAVVSVKFTNWNGKETQIRTVEVPDGTDGCLQQVSVELPKYSDAEKDKATLKEIISRVLKKAGEDGKYSIAFSLQNILNWSTQGFLECLLAETWKHFKSTTQDKPVFVEICGLKSDKYAAANFYCVGVIANMEKEIGISIKNPLKTELVEGELNNTKADVIVNTTSTKLALNAGAVSVALLKTAGDRLQEDCKTFYPKGINWGEIAVTQGYALPCSYVFHGALPPYLLRMDETDKYMAFREFMQACLTKASELGCRTIAFPALGTGNLKYPVKMVASEMLTCIENFQQNYTRSTLQKVYIVVYPTDKKTLQIFQQLKSELATEQNQPTAYSSTKDFNPDEDENVTTDVTVELTGNESEVTRVKEWIRNKWKKILSDYPYTIKMRLPPSLRKALCTVQCDKLENKLKDIDVTVSKVGSSVYIIAQTFKSLRNAFSIIIEGSAGNDGQQCYVGRINELNALLEINNVSVRDYEVMKKFYISNFNDFKKAGFNVLHRENCLVIEGKIEGLDSVGSKIKEQLTHIRKLQKSSIDGNQLRVPKEMLEKTIKDFEENHLQKYDRCILLDTKSNELSLFGWTQDAVADLKDEVSEKLMSPSVDKGIYPIELDKKKSNLEPTKTESKLRDTSKNKEKLCIPLRAGRLKVFVYKYDLLNTPVECIVNAANEHLSHNAGVAAAIANAAGSALIKESQSYIQRFGKIPAGDVVTTKAGHMNYRCIIHAVGPNWREYKTLNHEALKLCKLAIQSVIEKCLAIVDKYNMKTVAIPAISAGYHGGPIEICALQYAYAINRYLRATKCPTVKEIHFVDLNGDTVDLMKQIFYDYFIDNKVADFDSRYLTDKIESKKMNDQSKTDQGTFHVGDEHTSTPSITKSDIRDKVNKTEQEGVVLDLPVVYQSPFKSTVVQFTSYQELQLYTADILAIKSVDVIVVCEDPSGNCSGAIVQQLNTICGKKYTTEKMQMFKNKLGFGHVAVTAGGNSQFRYVFHAILHDLRQFEQNIPQWYDAFQKILRQIFKKAVLLKCSSIAMPVFNTDSRMQDISEYARNFIDSYKSFCLANPSQILAVHLVSDEPSRTATLKSLFERHIMKHEKRSAKRYVTEQEKHSDSQASITSPPDMAERHLMKRERNFNGKTTVTSPTGKAERDIMAKERPFDSQPTITLPPVLAEGYIVHREKDSYSYSTATSPPVKAERHIMDRERHSDSKTTVTSRHDQILKADVDTDKQIPDEIDETNRCAICLDNIVNPKKLKCGHVFCSECINQHLKTKKNCPICGKVFGILTGNQPSGTMNYDVIPNALPGYEEYETIKMVYKFSSGTQGKEHPEPGKAYTGISRVAYLPDIEEGRQVLKLLEVAFKRKLTFTIGQSRTTGQTGVITWNDIHHKTSMNPNSQFGYPDPTYFDRVKDELAAKGITMNDIQ